MTIFKNNEKPNLEDLAERMDKLEKRVGFLILPALVTCLDEGPLNYRRGMGGHPLISWIIAKLRDSDDTLPQEVREFLTRLLEKHDFGTHRPLRK